METLVPSNTTHNLEDLIVYYHNVRPSLLFINQLFKVEKITLIALHDINIHETNCKLNSRK